jgi:hypothetical protein
LPVCLIGGPALIASTYALFLGTAANPDHLVLLYALAGFCIGTTAVVPYVMVRAFPSVVRFTGVSFSYNVAYAIFGGLTPVAVPLMLKYNKLGPAHYVAFTVVVGVVAVVVNAARGTTYSTGSTTVE